MTARLRAAPHARMATEPVPTEAEVVILGAGLAGLGAAVDLARAGIDIRVLEAQTRVGGRVLTLREPFADGQYAEAGGLHRGQHPEDGERLTIALARPVPASVAGPAKGSGQEIGHHHPCSRDRCTPRPPNTPNQPTFP